MAAARCSSGSSKSSPYLWTFLLVEWCVSAPNESAFFVPDFGVDGSRSSDFDVLVRIVSDGLLLLRVGEREEESLRE